MLKELRIDLHIHTCLSPCGDFGMRPGALVRRAREQGLDVIGIADHNSAENVAAVRKAGEREGLAVIGGMEITSREEVHILAFFDDDEALLKLQDVIYEKLDGENDADYFGEQLLADENDAIVGVNDRLLIGATRLGINQIVDLTHDLGGISIASHIDREAFSLVGQLGFVPPGLPLDALELSPGADHDILAAPGLAGRPHIVASDAHYLDDIGKGVTVFKMARPLISEFHRALQGSADRAFSI